MKAFFFFLLLTFTAVTSYSQTYSITHEGEIGGNWIYSTKSNEFKYHILYTGHDGVTGSDEDKEAQLFINWMANDGGISLSASNGDVDSYYSDFINDHEYNDYLSSVQANGSSMSRSDYFKSKYPNGVASSMSEMNLNGYKTIYSVKIEDDSSMGILSKYYNFFIFINENSGILASGSLKYIQDKSTLSMEAYEQLMFQHLSELRFTPSSGNPTDASAPTVSTTPTEESDTPWTVIIGTVSAAAVALIIRKLVQKTAAKATSKGKNEKNTEEQEEEAHYILQLNQDVFNLKLDESTTLDIQVIKVTAKGPTKVAAEIHIQNPEKLLIIQSQSAGSGMKSILHFEKAPSQPQFQLIISATADGKSIQKTVDINFGGKMQILIETLPDNKRSMRPDINQILTCQAEVVDETGKSRPELTKKIKFKPQSDWLDLSDPVMEKDKILINVSASNPTQHKASSNVPNKVTLTFIMEEVAENEEILQTDLVIDLLDCKLDTEISTCSFPVSDQQTEIKFEAYIENFAPNEPWFFEGQYKYGGEPDEPLTHIDIAKKSDTEAIITLTGPILKPTSNETYLSKTLVISAYQGDEKPLERHIQVMVTQVGLFIKNGVESGNQLSYLAQGAFEKNIEFVLYKYDQKSNEIIVDQKGLKNLKFELKNEEQDIINFESVLKVTYSFTDLVGNIPYGRYQYKSEEQIPGFGDVFTLTYLVQAPCEDHENPEQFQQELNVKVKTYGIGSEFPEWVEAYNNCKKVIETLVPIGETRTKLAELLEARKYTLGAEGLNELRKRIWKIAYNLILAEGAEGYKEEEKWANYITTTLEWTEWAGDLAFNALVAYYMKNPAASVGINMAKAGMIEALNFYIYEKGGIDEFMDRQYEKIIPLLLDVAKGRLISVENIEMVVKKNKPLAIAIFVSCEFLYNLYQTKSVVEAAKLTAAQIRDEFIIQKLTLHLHKNQLKYNIKLTTIDESLNDVMKAVKTKDGKQFIEVDKLMEIMRDPAQVRTLKNHAPDWLKKVFDDSRSEIYKKHDSELKKYISDTYKIDPNDVKIDDFRTPGTDGSYNLNTDRDYRVLRKVKTSDGQEIWIEVQKSNWIDKSYETFGDITGKPYGISDKEWAEKHLQRATDRFDAEAGKDYSDHVYNAKTGEIIKDQPNIVKVKHGEGTLYDAEGLGKMYQNKVMNALEPGTLPEAYAQAQKAVDSLKKVQNSYTSQNLDVPKTPEKLTKAMEIIEKAKTDVRATPEDVQNMNQKLKDLGYNDLGEVAHDMSNEFKNLKKYDQPNEIYKIN